MLKFVPKISFAATLLVCSLSALAQSPKTITNIQLGPRPFFLVNG